MLKRQKKKKKILEKNVHIFRFFLVFFIFITNFFFSKAKTTSKNK
jgi:hypothetical protein